MRKLIPIDMITASTTILGQARRFDTVVIDSDMDGSPQGER